MKILVINGSPKGNDSITVHTVKYLETKNPQHEFQYLNVGQLIRVLQKNFTKAEELLNWSELILFSYPVYTFIAPAPIHRFIELIQENHISLANKFVTQVTTSKHFYDITAHNYIFEMAKDFNMKYIKGFSADMDDLLTKNGQKQARDYFSQLMLDIKNDNYDKTIIAPNRVSKPYLSDAKPVSKDSSKTIALVSCYKESDTNTIEMVKQFKAKCPYEVKEYNIYNFKFQGGCLGCFSCAVSGHCIYKDGFEDLLRNEIQNKDAIIYAFPIINHYTYSNMKNYDDRQFVNGHRTVTQGTPIGYLLSGDYSNEQNLKVIIEGRAEVGGTYLCHIASDEIDPSGEIDILIENLKFAIQNKPSRPKNFYGDGGNRIFRDLIYEMRGLMQADHKFYKKTGQYKSFPQKHKGRIFQMKMVGLLMKSKKVQQKMKGKMGQYIVAPYEKVIQLAKDVKDE